MTEEQHVAYVQRDMIEIYGEVVAEQWTWVLRSHLLRGERVPSWRLV